MELKKMIPILIIGGGLAYTIKERNNTPSVAPPPPPPPNNATYNTGSGGLQTAGGSGGMIAVSGIDPSSQPDYKTWNRSHWAAWCQSLLTNNSPEDTKVIVWNAWRNQENEFADKYPSADILFFSLALYQPSTAIGTFNITSNSSPVYDTWSAWWNNVDVWECADWQNWFDVMESDLGLTTAQQKFVSAWSYEDNWASASNARVCSHDCTFIDEMTQRGVDVAFFGVRTVCNLVNIPYNLVQAGENVSQGVSNATSTAAGLTPWVLYGGAAFLAVKAYQSINA